MAAQREAVAEVGELDDGQMMECTVGDTDILLAKIDGSYFANGAHCTHYGAPLVDGVLGAQGELVCPWHHAVYDLTTGDHVESPGRDCLSHFDVDVEDGRIYVELPDDAAESHKPAIAGRDPEDERHFLIVGGGQAGSVAAETLRKHGYSGRLTVVSSDDYLPYDRPNLSKAFLSGEAEDDWLPLRPDSFWSDAEIEFLTNTDVVSLDRQNRQVSLGNGQTLTYDKLLLATGGEPNVLSLDGADLKNVCLLRSRADAQEIVARAKDATRAVIIGSSFIGMEVAASFRQRDLTVHVASIDKEPFAGPLGARVGRYFRRMHEAEGVQFQLSNGVDQFLGEDGTVTGVRLEDGTELDADLVVVGAGVHPATDFVGDALYLREDGSIKTDSTLRAAPGIWAAGDIARFPDLRTGRLIRIEHWRLAGQHGKIAALNMLNPDEEHEYTDAPFFWTRQFGKTFKYVGHADQWDEILVHGAIQDGDFIAYYVEDDQVLAAAGTRGDDLTYIQALMRHQAMPPAEELRAGDWPS